MEILFRIGSRVYWMNSGHMLGGRDDEAEPDKFATNLDLLLLFLETNDVRITCCEGSWRKKANQGRQGQPKSCRS